MSRKKVYHLVKAEGGAVEVKQAYMSEKGEKYGHRVRFQGDEIEFWPKGNSKNFFRLVYSNGVPRLEPQEKIIEVTE